MTTKKEIDDRKQGLEASIKDIQSLLGHPGWQKFQNTIRVRFESAMTKLDAAKTGDEVLKLAGAVSELRKLKDLPQDEITFCQRGIEAANQELAKLQ